MRYHLSVLRVWALVDTTPPTDEHLILYFSIDSSTVRTRLEGGSREVRDVDAGGWGDEGANVINYPSNDSDWWAAGQVQPGRNSVEVVTATNVRRNRVIHTTPVNSNKDHSSKFDQNIHQYIIKINILALLIIMAYRTNFRKYIIRNTITIGKRHFFTFLIAIFVAEMHNRRYCPYRNWNENVFLYFENIFFPNRLICNERERGRAIDREVLGTTLDTWTLFWHFVLEARERTVPMINQMRSRVVHTCSWNTTVGRQREARSGAVHDKVDLFFSHPTPGLTRGWTRCFNILIGRRNGRFRDLAFYNDILPAFRS